MELTYGHFLFVSTLLFAIGLFGLMVRRNIFILLMSIELLLNAANLAFVTFAHWRGDAQGLVYAFFIIALAAAEACVGLAIVVVFYRLKKSINIDEVSEFSL